MKPWMNLCGHDPILDLIEDALGPFTLLRRPDPNLRPMDALLLKARGGRFPEITPLGDVRALLGDGARQGAPSLRSGPAPGFQAARQVELTGELAVWLAGGWGVSGRVAASDTLRFAAREVVSVQLDALPELSRINTDHPVAGALREGARLFLVTGVLAARDLCVERVAARSARGSAGALSGGHDDEALLDTRHNENPLAFAVTGLSLRLTGDGRLVSTSGPRRGMLAQAPPKPQALVSAGIVVDLAAAASPGPLPPRAEVPPQLPGSDRRRRGNLAPSYAEGTTELWDPNGAAAGMAFVPRGGQREDSVTSADGGLRRAGARRPGLRRADTEVGRHASVEDFLSRVWQDLGWAPGRDAVQQSARVTRAQVEDLRKSAFLADLAGVAAGGLRALRLEAGGQARLWGLALLVDDPTSASDGSWRRTLHQVTPRKMPSTSDQAWTQEDLGTLDLDSLRALLAELGDQGPLDYALCDCVVREVDGVWGLSQSLAPPEATPFTLRGLTS